MFKKIFVICILVVILTTACGAQGTLEPDPTLLGSSGPTATPRPSATIAPTAPTGPTTQLGTVEILDPDGNVVIYGGQTIENIFKVHLQSKDIVVDTEAGPLCNIDFREGGDNKPPYWRWEASSFNYDPESQFDEFEFGIYADSDAPAGECLFEGDIYLRDLDTQQTETHHIQILVTTKDGIH
ncbi:MAG TPA: hypothetical protein VL401_01740 [Alphaproteobacteria bacterium]|nr:hypothetical protein [Alphaproteobacteria bacterium]